MAGYEKVVSKDGTAIAFRRIGQGPPLVLVHGTTGSDFSWRFVEPFLEPHFTLYLMQRRGRGESGDGPVYSMAREAEDVAAVVDSIGGPVHLFGHSYGADCALEASLLTKNLRKLVLYEPAVEFSYPEGSIEEQERLAAQGRYEELIEFAPTVPRESREDRRYTVTAARFRNMSTPNPPSTWGREPGILPVLRGEGPHGPSRQSDRDASRLGPRGDDDGAGAPGVRGAALAHGVMSDPRANVLRGCTGGPSGSRSSASGGTWSRSRRTSAGGSRRSL